MEFAVCFVIAQKYDQNYRSYVKEYVDNIRRFYPNNFVVIVDNQSENLSNIVAQFENYNDLIMLKNESGSIYELGAYTCALQWLIGNGLHDKYDYFVFSQDTFILAQKYDFNRLMNNDVVCCSVIEHSEYGSGYLEEEKRRVLEPLGLYNRMDEITFCYGSNFVCHRIKILELFQYVKSIVLTQKKDSEACERYMARIIYELNDHRTFNIDGFYYDYMKKCNYRFAVDCSNIDYSNMAVYFQKRHQMKT